MKKFTYPAIAIVIALFGAGCADEPVHSSTTTTEETEIHHPVTPVSQSTTTETRSVQPGY